MRHGLRLVLDGGAIPILRVDVLIVLLNGLSDDLLHLCFRDAIARRLLQDLSLKQLL